MKLTDCLANFFVTYTITQTNVHDEILRTFEREAHAAYSEAKRACETHVAHHDKEICLAKARLQFDADMRYAQQRADQGY